MARFVLFIVLGMTLLLAGCDSGVEGFVIPPQQYSTALDGSAGPEGALYGRILFPSEYGQRSVGFLIGGREFVTQPDGRFLVEGVPAGVLEFRLHVRRYEAVERSFTIEPGQSVAAGDFRLRVARGRVMGRLVAETGESGAEISLKLMPRGEMAVTDSDGIFQFIGVNSGEHLLQITDENFFSYNRKFTLGNGERRNLGNVMVFLRAGSPLAQSAALNSLRGNSSPAAESAE